MAPTPTSTIFFPQQPPVKGERVVDEALLIGELILVDGCLRVTSQGGTSYLLVWPPDVTLRTENNRIEILNQAGHVVARVGDVIQVGGGEIGATPASDERVPQHLPPACPGPYWLVGDLPPE